jgi:hypothetical protein
MWLFCNRIYRCIHHPAILTRLDFFRGLSAPRVSRVPSLVTKPLQWTWWCPKPFTRIINSEWTVITLIIKRFWISKRYRLWNAEMAKPYRMRFARGWICTSELDFDCCGSPLMVSPDSLMPRGRRRPICEAMAWNNNSDYQSNNTLG